MGCSILVGVVGIVRVGEICFIFIRFFRFVLFIIVLGVIGSWWIFEVWSFILKRGVSGKYVLYLEDFVRKEDVKYFVNNYIDYTLEW